MLPRACCVAPPLTIANTRPRFARTGKRDDIFIATRFGLVPDRVANGEPEYVEQALNKSLERLEVDAVDLYYLHRCVVAVSASAQG